MATNDNQQMEVGGSGTISAVFKDAFDNVIVPKSVNWSSTGSVAVSATEDPTKANIVAFGAGPATITAVGSGEQGGTATTSIDIAVLQPDHAATGELSIQVQPAAKKPAPAVDDSTPAKKPAPAVDDKKVVDDSKKK